MSKNKGELQFRPLKKLEIITKRPEGMAFDEYKTIQKQQKKLIDAYNKRGNNNRTKPRWENILSSIIKKDTI